MNIYKILDLVLFSRLMSKLRGLIKMVNLENALALFFSFLILVQSRELLSFDLEASTFHCRKMLVTQSSVKHFVIEETNICLIITGMSN